MRVIEMSERIRVHRRGLDAIPLEFSWRGRRYAVRRIEWMRQVGERTKNGKTYQLQTAQGLKCRISHDEQGDIWRVDHILGQRGGMR